MKDLFERSNETACISHEGKPNQIYLTKKTTA